MARGAPMRPRAFAPVVALAALVASCGGSPPAAPSHPAKEWSTPASASGFGAPMIAAARAMLSATQRRDYDPGWNCADPQADLRATPASAAEATGKLGGSPVLVLAAVRLTLNAAAAGAVPVTDMPDDPAKVGATPRVFVQGYANISPDAKVTWSEVKAYASALEEPNKARASIDDLAGPLKSELRRLVDSARSPDCRVPVTTIGDIEELPYAMGPEERGDVQRALDENQRGLSRVCALASKASAKWDVHFSHLEAVFIGGGALVKLRSKLAIQNGAVCLGAVDVVKVASM